MTEGYFLLSVSDLKVYRSDQVFILKHQSIFPLYKGHYFYVFISSHIPCLFCKPLPYMRTIFSLAFSLTKHPSTLFMIKKKKKLLLQIPFLVPELTDSLCLMLLLDYDSNYILFLEKNKNIILCTNMKEKAFSETSS